MFVRLVCKCSLEPLEPQLMLGGILVTGFCEILGHSFSGELVY